ncbi:hypothetical protein A4X06_0g5181 [Tilletia controversa]|uniref:Uncharacterized protein n=2 Tax=Tilletia TaxID=13289 RepID=A0A8X7MQZ1_9BASI|nr:hypothetical protein CF335_g7475 [Tilletia laevis]KAE8186460.1 hypothetical protein CF336_g6979 [Tilletia laevis]KAE8243841.1 hypothetical protein A4X03_0g7667 [Tilletia caries]KAE8246109.1 hypothetical protein A4X06_0g5181 [Tilletia controversa]
MQIRRSSNLTFLVSAVLFCSMAVTMVAAGPAPASAISNDLEQHPAGAFVKRVLRLEALEAMSKEELVQLLVSKKTELQSFSNIAKEGDKAMTFPALAATLGNLRKYIKQTEEEVSAIEARLGELAK